MLPIKQTKGVASMKDLMIFEGNEVEIILGENGEPLFELYSTGMALGHVKYAKGKAYPRRDRIDKDIANAEISTVVQSGQQYLTEEQLYDFMLECKTDKCKPFKKWVTHEVLPSIRKDGGYIMTKEEDTDEEIMARALLIAQSTIERKNKEIERKNREIKALENTVTILQPKADYMDSVLSSDKLLTTTSIAKDLGMSAKELNKILNEKGIIYKLGGTWYLYSKYQHMVPEYADYVINEYGQQLKWTEKGRKFIIDILNK